MIDTKPSRDIVDFSEHGEPSDTFSEGELTRLDRENEVIFKWFKERTIVWLSASTIFLILLASLVTLAFSSNEDNMNWARQCLTVLLGFAAGAIWNSKSSKK